MLINISRELCIGAAPCVAIAGDVFQLDEEGKAILIGPSVDDANTQLAAEACPVRAIFIYDDQQKQLFPPETEMPKAYTPEPVHGAAAPETPASPTPAENPANNNQNPANPDLPAAA